MGLVALASWGKFISHVITNAIGFLSVDMLVTIFANTVLHVKLTAKIDAYTANVTNLAVNLVYLAKRYAHGTVNILLVPNFVVNLVIDKFVTRHVKYLWNASIVALGFVGSLVQNSVEFAMKKKSQKLYLAMKITKMQDSFCLKIACMS